MRNLMGIVVVVGALGACSKKTESPPAKTEPAPAPVKVEPAKAVEPAPAPAVPTVTFGTLPTGWTAEGGKLGVVVGVNDSKFPGDNAVFDFEYSLQPKGALPDDPAAHKEALAKSGMKIVADRKVANGHYYESADHFRYFLEAGDQRISCGGSLYKNPDYNKIPKERDAAVAEAKKLCEGAKL
jgi:hypothetical protein